MPFDLERLRRDVRARITDPATRMGPGGRPRTGAMAVVRQSLREIEALHAEGASWVDIAAALAAQGILQGDGAPLTGRRLTALIASIRRQEANRVAATAKRAARADLRREPAPSPADRPSLALAPELESSKIPSAPSVHGAEEEIRLQKLRRVETFFKSEPSNEDQ